MSERTNPVRVIHNRGIHRVIGRFPSLKNAESVPWESQLERDYCFYLEVDPEVVRYRSQPLQIQLASHGTILRYTPDFLVERRALSELVEIKPSARVGELKHRFSSIAIACRELGFTFRVVTDTDIRVSPVLENLKLLFRYARSFGREESLDSARPVLTGIREGRLEDYLKAAETEGIPRGVIYSAMHYGLLLFDLRIPIAPDMILKCALNGQ